MAFWNFLAPGIKAIGGILDEYIESPEEKKQAQLKFLQLSDAMKKRADDYEQTLMEKKGDIIAWEARSTNFITSAWRPITMLCLVFTVMAHTFGLTPPGVELDPEFWPTIQMGLGGYLGGRSVEKVTGTMADAKVKIAKFKEGIV